MVHPLAQGGESRFFVDSGTLTSQSQLFGDAIAGKWKEAIELKIDLQDWDGATVGRTAQSIYR